MRNKLDELEKKIDISFKDKKLLKNAFIHRSYLNEHRNLEPCSNEKLEFLGDSVLSLITSVYLFKRYQNLNEGDYTDIRACMVRMESLAKVAGQLDLGQYLYLSKGEERSGGRKNLNLLADCFEALIGAIFLDRGFKTVYTFVAKYLFNSEIKKIIKEKRYLPSKSRLQEYIQAKYKVLPRYRLVGEKGPDHKPKFLVAVYLKEKKLAVGVGTSKKQAEDNAARKALELL